MINRNNISTEMINVCYAIYDKTGNFSKIAATSILSLLENTESWVTIHILHDNTLSTENIKNFIYLARKYNQHIIFYNIEELLPTEISLLKQENQGRFSIAAMYRLLIMHLLPNTISKVIYLDCDTIVNIDIQDLYDEDIKNNVLGAVAECDATYNHAVEKDICNDGFVEQNNYFCSGILLINMDEYRKYPSLCIDGIKFLAEHPSYDCPDQDILNYYFSNKYKKLSVKYNTFTKALKLKDININIIEKRIYHYAGSDMNLTNYYDIYNQLFFDYYIKTPWFDGKLFLKAINACLKTRQDTDMYLINIISNKKMIFFGDKNTAINVINESYINLNSAIFINIVEHHANVISINPSKILDYYKNSDMENTILIILSDVYMDIKIYLIKHGLVENKDFIDGNFLLKPDKMNADHIIKLI